MSAKRDINDKLQIVDKLVVAAQLRYGGVVNNQRDCLVHFLRLLAVC